MNEKFLPISKEDMAKRGWDYLDVIIVSGDAYVDHPSYAAAVIGRVLESDGFRVGIIAQPDWHTKRDFERLGRPRLFFGVTSGNLDSMVANYSANKKPRREDEYSPGGKAGLRPDRASIVYSNRIREAYSGVPIVLGGIEASLRRLAHYDYWDDKVRRSLILDAKADMLVYGMGEKQILEIAQGLGSGIDIKELNGIRGTVVVRKDAQFLNNYITIPSFYDVSTNHDKFNEAFRAIYREADPFSGKAIVQPHGDRYVIQFPSALPLRREELDKIYELPYTRTWHSSYNRGGGVPGFETVRSSVISHRGCAGGCSFCSLYLHQGRIVQSRSIRSILSEIKHIASSDDFKGTITDIGGPTANLYEAYCEAWATKGACADRSCLMPQKCKNLKLGYASSIKLWKDASKIRGVKHIFVGSGLRYDLLTEPYSDEYLRELCASHISGRLKVAPEHSEDNVLRLMNKSSFRVYERFSKRFKDLNERLHKKQFLVNYIITGHPGSTLNDELALSERLASMNIYPEQIQDYIPLPMTVSACMYYTEKDPFSGKRLHVIKSMRDRLQARALLQKKQPKNRRRAREALRRLSGREDIS